ncbi:MAG: membrane protein YczE [Nocardioidaceae bacterium]
MTAVPAAPSPSAPLATPATGSVAGPVTRPARRQLAALSPLAQLRAGRLPRRLAQLLVGLVLYGVSMAMMVRSDLGLDPWDVLHFGLARLTGLSFGTVVVAVGVLVLLLWVPLRQMPGLGTVANVVVIGVVSDLALGVLATPHPLAGRWLLLLGGVALNGLAGALYIGSQLGPGPRDGLMTGLVRRTGRSVRLVRTSIEVSVVVAGWLLGGVVGAGTVIYAVSIGPLVQAMLPRCIVALPRAAGGDAFPENPDRTLHNRHA